jgi:hypothetical protein
MRKQFQSIVLLISIAFLLTAGRRLMAGQNPPDEAKKPAEQFLVLIPARDVADIQRDVESADRDRTAAGDAERLAQDQKSSLVTLIEEKKQAIAVNKDKLKAAKKDKNEAEIPLLTAEGKSLDRDKELLDQQLALREAEIILARARNEFASTTKQALDFERQLAQKRADQGVAAASKSDQARAARLLLDLEKATLEAQKKAADKQGEITDGLKKAIDHRLKTLEAQQNIFGGK